MEDDSAPFRSAASASSRRPPTAKKSKEPKEKRPARYRSTCPKKLYDRIYRGSSQPLYLIQRDLTVSRGTFTVLGSTGNVYEVIIDSIPSCTCPDFQRKQDLCKHLLFVLLKVVGLDQSNPLVFQKGLLQSEVREILELAQHRQVGGIPLANAFVRQRFNEVRGNDDGDVKESDTSNTRRQLDTDSECPICFELMSQSTPLTYCRSGCGINFHRDCVRRWCAASKRPGSTPRCPHCRSVWETSSENGDGKTTSSEGYINLGALQGQSPHRDTSTYHSSPARYYSYNRNKRGRYY